MQGRSSLQGPGDRSAVAATCEPFLHMVANKLYAYDVRIKDTRRTTFAGFLPHSCSRFCAQMPNFLARAIDAVTGHTACGAIEGWGAKKFKMMNWRQMGKEIWAWTYPKIDFRGTECVRASASARTGLKDWASRRIIEVRSPRRRGKMEKLAAQSGNSRNSTANA